VGRSPQYGLGSFQLTYPERRREKEREGEKRKKKWGKVVDEDDSLAARCTNRCNGGDQEEQEEVVEKVRIARTGEAGKTEVHWFW